MTTKADFSEEDWVRVVRAPFVAGMAITLADPGGPIEAAEDRWRRSRPRRTLQVVSSC